MIDITMQTFKVNKSRSVQGHPKSPNLKVRMIFGRVWTKYLTCLINLDRNIKSI